MTVVHHRRDLLSHILIESEMRTFLSDFSLVDRDLLSTGSQEASRHIAKIALQDKPNTKGRYSPGLGETPALEAHVPGTNVGVKQHPKESETRIPGEVQSLLS